MKDTVRKWIELLESREPLQDLSPRRPWNASLDDEIAGLQPAGFSGTPLAVLALKSGLHLWNDSLDRSHTLSQDIENPTGSYWHGIMHRMEGDYSNSKYWFRLTGTHPAMEVLQREAAGRLAEAGIDKLPPSGQKDQLQAIADQREWDPSRLIDAVSHQESGRAPEETRLALQMLQKLEIAILIRYCEQEAAK